MFSRTVRLAAAAVVVACVATSAEAGDDAVAKVYEQLVLKDRWAVRWQALDVSKRALLDASLEDGWALMAGVDAAALDAAMGTIEGTKIVNRGDGLLKGAEIVVTSVEVGPGDGLLDAKIGIEAKKSVVKLQLAIEGTVLVSGVQHFQPADGGAIARVSLRIQPNRVAPTLSVAGLELPVRDLWTRIAPELATALLDPALFERTIDLPASFGFDLGMDESDVAELGESARITYTATVPASRIEVMAAYAAPVYDNDAIWMLGRMVDYAPEPIRPVPPPDLPPDALKAEIAALEADVAGLLDALGAGAIEAAERGLAVRLDGGAIRQAVALLGDLPLASRTLTVQSTAVAGDYLNDRWHDDILGDGGLRVSPASGQGNRVTASVYGPSVSMVGGELALSLSVSADARADVAAHADPVLVGGGFGTSVGIVGSAVVSQVTAFAKPGIVADARGRPIAAAAWRTGCEPIVIRATTDGRLKFNFGWMSVPAVGGELTMPTSPAMLAPLSVLDTRPALYALPPVQPMRATGKLAEWELVPPALAVVYRVTPRTFAVAGEDLVMVGDLDLATVARAPAPDDDAAALVAATASVEAERAEVAAATEVALDGLKVKATCAAKPTFELVLGDHEIGPNNEIVKVFGQIAGVVEDVVESLPQVTIRSNGGVEIEVPGVGGLKTHQGHGGLGVTLGGWKF